MASVLDFERYGGDLNRELLRRIGYTNGLHKIRRFARVVEYLYPVMPTSAAELTQIIIREENQRGEAQLSGMDYALGIVDVAKALLLLERFGPKIALSSQGYACHALIRSGSPQHTIDTFLFEKVIEADGEYTLNLLRLVSEGVTETVALGDALVTRFLALIEYKIHWAETSIHHRFSQKALILMLTDARRILQKTVAKEEPALVEFFFKHTVNPRLEWLEDFGCLRSAEDGSVACTDRGARVLQQVKQLGGWQNKFVFLPLDHWLASYLDIPNLYAANADNDVSWRIVAAAAAAGGPAQRVIADHVSFLDEIKLIYPFVKLANFNEADALSLYEVIATREAEKGRVLSQVLFERVLVELVREFTSEIFKLSKRRGKGLYIALKKSA